MSREVTITAFGMIKEHLPDEITVSSGQTVGQAVATLRLKYSEAIAVLVNERVVSWNYLLKPGDHVHLIPAIGGG